MLAALVALGVFVYIELWRWKDRSHVRYKSFEYRHAFQSNALKQFVELWSTGDKDRMVFARYGHEQTEYVKFSASTGIAEAENMIMIHINKNGNTTIEHSVRNGTVIIEYSASPDQGDTLEIALEQLKGATEISVAAY